MMLGDKKIAFVFLALIVQGHLMTRGAELRCVEYCIGACQMRLVKNALHLQEERRMGQ